MELAYYQQLEPPVKDLHMELKVLLTEIDDAKANKGKGGYSKEIRSKIIQYLEDSGMSIKDFAEKSGIAGVTISQWKRKKKDKEGGLGLIKYEDKPLAHDMLTIRIDKSIEIDVHISNLRTVLNEIRSGDEV